MSISHVDLLIECRDESEIYTNGFNLNNKFVNGILGGTRVN